MAQITVKELSEELGTDGRTTRKFLRSHTEKDSHPGKGGRWSIEKRDVQGLKKKFKAWDEARRTDEEPGTETE